VIDAVVVVEKNGIRKMDTAARIRGLGVKLVVVVDRADDSPFDEADFVVRSDLESADAAAADLESLCQTTGISVRAVAAFTEYRLKTAAALCEHFAAKGPTSHSVGICRDKCLTKEVCSRDPASRPYIARFSKIADAKDLHRFFEESGGNCIIKPVDCSASFGVYHVQEKGELDDRLRELSGLSDGNLLQAMGGSHNKAYFLAEEYIEGFEVSVESLTVGGTTETILIHDKASPVEAPDFLEECFVTDSVRLTDELRRELKQATRSILKAIEFENGVTHIEYRVRNGHPYLVEINGRPGGGLIVESVFFATGINIIEEYFRRVLGLPRSECALQLATVQRTLYSPVGKITKVAGLGTIPHDDHRLKEASVACEVGDVVTTREAGGMIDVLVAGDDPDELLAFANGIVDHLQIHTS
jgi:S-sulfo-L-cysteine synthase (3-phospho-L-serine-dependent)